MPAAGEHALGAAWQTASMLLSGKAAPLSAVSATCKLHSLLTAKNIASAACWQIPCTLLCEQVPLMSALSDTVHVFGSRHFDVSIPDAS